jgi:drug/metabolite transporter (DMT)-like permease
MKLNFWQWIGILLLVLGGAWILFDWTHPKNKTQPVVAPTTQTAPVP